MKALLVICALGLCSCESDTGGPVAGGVLPGNIMGRILLTDSLGKDLTDHSGAVVTIENRPYTATTLPDGSFTLRDIPPGTYTFLVKKDSFTTKKRFNIQHVGNGTYYLPGYVNNTGDVILKQIPRGGSILNLNPFFFSKFIKETWKDSSGATHVVLDSTLAAKFTVKQNYVVVYPTIYYSTDPNLDPAKPSSIQFSQYCNKVGAEYQSTIFKDSLLNHGFTTGSQVYVRSVCSYDGYFNDILGNEVLFTYAYYSSVRSFVLP